VDEQEDRGRLDDVGLPEPGRRRRRRWGRGGCGCLATLLAAAVLVGGFYLALTKGVEWVGDQFSEPEDFAGPGAGRVLFEVEQGDSATDMGRSLKDQGVVASVDAFINAANARSDQAAGIQVGYYELQREMKADDALSILVDPANLVRNPVTIPEGLRVVDVVDLLAEKTRFSKQQYNQVLKRPQALGLPPYADGNPEGYLFPATYEVPPTATPQSILKQMVDRWRQAADEAGLEEAAQRLGYTPSELMTVASLVEAESGPKYAPQVARVIYNRLESDATNGLLQLDATVNYAHGRNLGARTTAQDREIDSPYNTYRVPGLPPGPIEAPGDAAIEAAANPAEGDWLYYVTVNLATGETKFAETLDEHNRNVEELNEYCRNESDRC
jgi:UPF0755 protein